jgi:predicted DNA-binding protein
MATHRPAPGNTTINAQLPIDMKQKILNRASSEGKTASHVLRELLTKSLEVA